jgi:hypothetical protein
VGATAATSVWRWVSSWSSSAWSYCQRRARARRVVLVAAVVLVRGPGHMAAHSDQGFGLEAERGLAELFGGAGGHAVELLGGGSRALRAPRRATRRTRIISTWPSRVLGWWRPLRPGLPGRRPGRRSGRTCPGAGGCWGRGGRPPAPGGRRRGRNGPGASAFNADALDRSETLGPGGQGEVAAGRGRERLGVSSRPAWSITAAICRSRWVSTPTVTGLVGAGMLSMAVPSGPLGQGRHAPIGMVDSIAMGPLGQAPAC